MASIIDTITRDEVQRLIAHARNTGQDEKVYVKTQLTARYPGIENSTIRRNGKVYLVLDYLVEDTESYATSSGNS